MLKNLFSKSKKPLVGVDISSSAVKLLSLNKSGRGFTIDAFAKVALSEGAVVEKEIKDQTAVANAIRQGLAYSRPSSKNAAVAISDNSVITKIIQLDADLSELEMEEQVMLEADKHIPYPIDEVRLDFKVLNKIGGEDQRVEVLLAASRAETVDSYVETLEMAGLTTKIVDVESYAISKACDLLNSKLSNEYSGKIVAIVDIGAKTTHLTILENGLPIFNRIEQFGGDRLTNAIANQFGLSYEEAESSKIKNTLPETYNTDVLRTFQEDAIQHVKRGLKFYSSARQSSNLDHVLLMGGCATLPNFSEHISNELKIPTTVARPLNHLKTSKRVDKKEIELSASSLMICSGLALRSFD